MEVIVDAAWVLRRAAFIARHYDRNAKDEVLFNLTDGFHLCGLIERAASMPRSGATHRRNINAAIVHDAKAAFCRAHQVNHPSAWEWEAKRSPADVELALMAAALA